MKGEEERRRGGVERVTVGMTVGVMPLCERVRYINVTVTRLKTKSKKKNGRRSTTLTGRLLTAKNTLFVHVTKNYKKLF
jgi:hypothetical protein